MSLLKNKFKEKLSVVILCAGEGTRLKEITKNIPKPLIKIELLNNTTILNHLINNLIFLGIKQIAIVIGYLGDRIRDFISSIIKNNRSLEDKLIIINTENQYKLGPLYSFLSITNNKILFNPANSYIMIPGDTIFHLSILKEVLLIISKNYQLIQDHPFVFYRNIRLKTLKKIHNRIKLISTVEVEKIGSEIVLKKISQLRVCDILPMDVLNQSIPIFALSYDFINEILKLKEEILVKTVREAINHMIINGKKIFAFEIESKDYFYDIDNIDDLTNLNKKKEDNRRSD
ncbi:MAG: sugar phosphate nucleotidyltransferase [Promethearchaeota archaeon]